MHLDVLFVIFIYPSIVYVSFQKKKKYLTIIHIVRNMCRKKLFKICFMMTNDISFSIIMMYPLKLMKSYLYNKQINETIEKLLCVACGVASYFIEAFFFLRLISLKP